MSARGADDHTAVNRATWDRWADLNYDSDFYDVEGFKAGRSSLDDIERAGVGDVDGKRLLHLQCHFGMDTLSWARLGASVVGVDYSERAIAMARQLAAETGITAEFVCCDVGEAPGCLEGAHAFDVVYTSYGAISWLPDLEPWARTIAHFLKPGGTFFVADHHPAVWVFDDTTSERILRYKYPYFSKQPIREEAMGNYAQPDAPLTTVTYSWQHTFEDILGALLGAGLSITSFKEYNRCAWAWFEWMDAGADEFWRMPSDVGDIPLMFSLTATKR